MTTEDKDVSPNEVESESGEGVEEDLESVKAALEEEGQKAERYLANWQRSEADLVNFRKRGEQERAELANFANETLVMSLLPALDDLERALGSVPEELVGTTWVDGIGLVYRKLLGILQAHGLSAIEAEGKDFDPNLHEAVMCVEGREGEVVEELQRGYKFRDRVIRAAMVKVGKE